MINQANPNVFSRSGGNGIDDVVPVNAPKIPIESTSITVQAELGIKTVVKNVIKIVKNFVDRICKWVENLFERLTTPGGGGEVVVGIYSNLDSEMLVDLGQNVMTSFGGTFKKKFDDGDEAWDIFDYPY